MQISTTKLDGVVLFTPTPHFDERGMFSRTADRRVLASVGIDASRFAQDSLSRSHRGVVRGMHLRIGGGESKLVRCSTGAIFDVVVDLRRSSPTYRQWQSFDLTGESQVSVWIPAGCAHGHQTLTESADVSYRIDREHDPSEDLAFAYNDPQLRIPWPLPVTMLSKRDRDAPLLAELGY